MVELRKKTTDQRKNYEPRPTKVKKNRKTIIAEQEPVTAEQEPVTAEQEEPVTAEQEPVTAEQEPVTAEQEEPVTETKKAFPNLRHMTLKNKTNKN